MRAGTEPAHLPVQRVLDLDARRIRNSEEGGGASGPRAPSASAPKLVTGAGSRSPAHGAGTLIGAENGKAGAPFTCTACQLL